MRNLIARALSLVLLWAFTGPVALVAASGQAAHECCYRSHSKPVNDPQLQNLGPSHECCRLIFASQLPTVATAPLAIAANTTITFTPDARQQRCPELRTSAHPERAPPFAVL